MASPDDGYYSNFSFYDCNKPSSSTSNLNKLQKINKKKKSSEKEKVRNDEIKKALKQLRTIMPFISDETDLSKIKTLRLATEYIRHLEKILQGEPQFIKHEQVYRPVTTQDFQQVVADEMQVTNTYKDRAELEMYHGVITVPQQKHQKFM